MHDQAVVCVLVYLPGISMSFNAQIDLVCYGLKALHRRCVVLIFYIKNDLPLHTQDFHRTGLGSVKKRSSDLFINSRQMKRITGRLLIKTGLIMAC
jgi:hypothetical protein